MPIKISRDLPAFETLTNENIFVMDLDRATTQRVRPLKIAILNLMPTKVETETQLLRMLGNSPLQVEVEFVQTATHISKNTSAAHMSAFYKTIDEIRDQNFDGMVITGAPADGFQGFIRLYGEAQRCDRGYASFARAVCRCFYTCQRRQRKGTPYAGIGQA